MYHWKYCHRAFDTSARAFDPHSGGTRLFNLCCEICRQPIPITADGRRFIVQHAPLCDVCGAPKLPIQNTVTGDTSHTHTC